MLAAHATAQLSANIIDAARSASPGTGLPHLERTNSSTDLSWMAPEYTHIWRHSGHLVSAGMLSRMALTLPSTLLMPAARRAQGRQNLCPQERPMGLYKMPCRSNIKPWVGTSSRGQAAQQGRQQSAGGLHLAGMPCSSSNGVWGLRKQAPAAGAKQHCRSSGSLQEVCSRDALQWHHIDEQVQDQVMDQWVHGVTCSSHQQPALG